MGPESLGIHVLLDFVPSHLPCLLTGPFTKPRPCLCSWFWCRWVGWNLTYCVPPSIVYLFPFLFYTVSVPDWGRRKIKSLKMRSWWQGQVTGDSIRATLLQPGPPFSQRLSAVLLYIANRDALLSCGGVGWASHELLSSANTFPHM